MGVNILQSQVLHWESLKKRMGGDTSVQSQGLDGKTLRKEDGRRQSAKSGVWMGDFYLFNYRGGCFWMYSHVGSTGGQDSFQILSMGGSWHCLRQILTLPGS
jgi:hypothetical protein